MSGTDGSQKRPEHDNIWFSVVIPALIAMSVWWAATRWPDIIDQGLANILERFTPILGVVTASALYQYKSLPWLPDREPWRSIVRVIFVIVLNIALLVFVAFIFRLSQKDDWPPPTPSPTYTPTPCPFTIGAIPSEGLPEEFMVIHGQGSIAAQIKVQDGGQDVANSVIVNNACQWSLPIKLNEPGLHYLQIGQWIEQTPSGAVRHIVNIATPTPTNSPSPLPVTKSPTATDRETPLRTATNTEVPEPIAPETVAILSTHTPTSTFTLVPPTPTPTPLPPTNTPTPIPPTPTHTPTPTPLPPTNTPTPIPPTPTHTPTPTPLPPTATDTPRSVPPTATDTPRSVPPTATPLPVTPTSTIAPAQAPQNTAGSVTLENPSDIELKGSQTFIWKTNITLGDNQCFEMVFWPVGQDPMVSGFSPVGAGTETTKSYNLDNAAKDPNLSDKLIPDKEYEWGVLLVQCVPYKKLKYLGASRRFIFKLSNGGGSQPVSGDPTPKSADP